jgi:hypothetical protein
MATVAGSPGDEATLLKGEPEDNLTPILGKIARYTYTIPPGAPWDDLEYALDDHLPRAQRFDAGFLKEEFEVRPGELRIKVELGEDYETPEDLTSEFLDARDQEGTADGPGCTTCSFYRQEGSLFCSVCTRKYGGATEEELAVLTQHRVARSAAAAKLRAAKIWWFLRDPLPAEFDYEYHYPDGRGSVRIVFRFAGFVS